MAAADEVPPATPKRWELGIVLVHGIGDHKQGETLLQFGEPLLDCVHRRVWSMWKLAAANAQLVFEEAGSEANRYYHDLLLGTKMSAYVDQSTPMPIRRLQADNANAEIKVSVPHVEPRTDEKGRFVVSRKVLTWNVQETWWGEQVIEPKAGDVIGWMMTRGPWIIGQFFYERFRNRSFRSRFSDTFLRPAYILWAALTALFAQIVLLGFALASLLPVVQRWVGPVLLKVAGVLGDAYVLIVQDLQHAAIVERVHDSLRALRPVCDKVVVIAHSQGSGVLFDALTAKTQNENWTPDHVITFGAGVAKLKTVFYAETREPWTMQVAGWCAFLGALVGGLVALALQIKFECSWLTAAGVGIVAFATFSYLVAKRSLFASYDRCREAFEYKQSRSSTPTHTGDGATTTATWTDFLASHDPVPMGELGVRSADGAQTILGYAAKTHRIRNELSWLSDHVTYVENKCEFCAPIVEKLLDWSHASAALRPKIPSVVLEAHRALSLTRGIFEHVVLYAYVAALPLLTASARWANLPFVTGTSDTINTLCKDWLPSLISSPLCVHTGGTGWASFVPISWALLVLVVYALLLSGLAILQRWWRFEIAFRALQDKALTQTQHRLVVGFVTVLYATPALALTCFFVGPWSHAYVIAGIFVCASFVPLSIGFSLANKSSSNRKKDFHNAITRLHAYAKEHQKPAA